MNILLLAPHPFFQDRGTPIAVKLMLEALSAQGHMITVLTYPEGEDVPIANCEIIRLPALPWTNNVKPGPSWKKIVYDLLMFFKARKLIQSRKFNLIHAVEESAFIAKHLKKRFGIPFIYDMDSSLPHQIVEKFGFLRFVLPILEKIEKGMVIESIGVIPVCKVIEKTVRKYAPDKLIQRLEDVSLLPSEPIENIDRRKKIDLDGPIIMYIGNLEKYQGIDLLMESFKIVSKKIAEASLVIIGGAKKDIENYKHLSKRLKLTGKTLFMGPRPISDLQVYFRQADILVSPRIRGQNTPMKIYSYLDSGKVLLATNLQTHTQVLDDEIAYLVKPNPQAMSEGLIKLLKNKNLRGRLAINAKKRIQQEYSLEAFKKKVYLYYKMIETKLASLS